MATYLQSIEIVEDGAQYRASGTDSQTMRRVPCVFTFSPANQRGFDGACEELLDSANIPTLEYYYADSDGWELKFVDAVKLSTNTGLAYFQRKEDSLNWWSNLTPMPWYRSTTASFHWVQVPHASSYTSGSAVTVDADGSPARINYKVGVRSFELRGDVSNLAEGNVSLWPANAGKINSNVFAGCPAKTVMFNGYSSVGYRRKKSDDFDEARWYSYTIQWWAGAQPGSVSPWATIGATYDSTTDNRWELEITEPSTASFASPSEWS